MVMKGNFLNQTCRNIKQINVAKSISLDGNAGLWVKMNWVLLAKGHLKVGCLLHPKKSNKIVLEQVVSHSE